MIEPKKGSNQDSFQKHNKRMKLFARFHRHFVEVNAARRDKSASPGDKLTFNTTYTRKKTGRAKRLVHGAGRSDLVLQSRVTRFRFSKN